MSTSKRANKPKNKHVGMHGIRVCVYKESGLGWTNVYLNSERLAKMLELANGNVEAVTHACRMVSMRPLKEQARSRSAAILNAAEALLKRARKLAEARQAQAAADNNQAWEQSAA